MKTIAKLMALCLLLGTVAFGQAAGAGDTKAPAASDQKAASDKPEKPKKAKKAKKSKDTKDTKTADDKGGEKK